MFPAGLLTIHLISAFASGSAHMRAIQRPGPFEVPYSTVAEERHQTQSSTGIRVWVNTSSRVYHCPGTRWYGATKSGKYLQEQDAVAQQYRAASGKSCAALLGGKADSMAATAVALDSSALSGKVWVNSSSRVYHCPGSRWFGATVRGVYMSEGEAQRAGNRAANGRKCS